MARKSVAEKYRRRLNRLDQEKRTMRSRVRSTLKIGLQQATDTQLYARTPLPVTRALFRSIFTKSEPESISVGFKGVTAPHNEIRLKMKGRSKLGGHDKEMKPGEFIEQTYSDRIARAGRGALQRVFGD